MSYLSSEMQRLEVPDLGRVVGFLGEATASEADEPFPPELLENLRRLVPCDAVGFTELDRVREKTLKYIQSPECDEGDDCDDDEAFHWVIHHEHPLCHHQNVTGDFRAFKLSDFVTKQEFRRSRVWVDAYGIDGLEHQMCVGLDAPLSHTKVFTFNRFGGRDFTERDRVVLNLLRPYLAQHYRAAQVSRRLRQALAVHEEAHTAVVLLDEAETIAYASSSARELFERWFGKKGAHLPDGLKRWLQDRPNDAREPFSIAAGDHVLIVHFFEASLLLEERRDLSSLTRREREILDLVAEGRTNAEIAAALWISQGTVRRHLENAFRKLGVHTRTAAVALVRDAPL
jgi:DNA-binding CsgD family transcriptional regulator